MILNFLGDVETNFFFANTFFVMSRPKCFWSSIISWQPRLGLDVDLDVDLDLS
jgi:hypothetical protein